MARFIWEPSWRGGWDPGDVAEGRQSRGGQDRVSRSSVCGGHQQDYRTQENVTLHCTGGPRVYTHIVSYIPHNPALSSVQHPTILPAQYLTILPVQYPTILPVQYPAVLLLQYFPPVPCHPT
ncbi:hypothetical protein Pcinc_007845 [Petrolisthes cinctipes]|uniref:Uncharacterized protein n=1 Tax=Petrolisthes cinctipes TaxID=88211 RepID=A0AAE1L025_PETCI|nr:hypothetical protein Pcinc_007845 [Petrolisthes cinctipes]